MAKISVGVTETKEALEVKVDRLIGLVEVLGHRIEALDLDIKRIMRQARQRYSVQ